MKFKVILADNGVRFEEHLTASSSDQATAKAMARNPGSTHVSTVCNTPFSDSSSGGGSFGSAGAGTVFGLAAVGCAVWAAASFLPWVMMVGAGGLGGWIGNKTGKPSLAFILAILAGTVGYHQGNKLYQEWNLSGGTNTSQVEQQVVSEKETTEETEEEVVTEEETEIAESYPEEDITYNNALQILQNEGLSKEYEEKYRAIWESAIKNCKSNYPNC